MSSQRPKKIKAGRGSITLPPELAAHYLRNAVQNASNNSNTSDDAEMKALMSMFVEIMGMDGTVAEGAKEMSFSFSSGSNNANTSTSQWPPSAAAAAAAAASGMFTSDGQWSFDYYNDDDDDDETDDVKPTAEKISAADAMARQIALDEQAAEEERIKKAAKRREKKHRKKEKAKQDALLKSQEAEQKKRSKQIQSWRSRVVAACQSKEDYKIQGLLAESPLGKQEEEDVKSHLEFFLPHCIAKSSRNDVGDQANQKLASFVVATDSSVVYSIGRDGRSALHTACLMGDCYFVKMATDKCEEDSPLDLWCKDAGWTPLHYAVAAANVEAVEDLLMLECEVDSLTDESLTCRASTGEGITARELAEILALGKQDQDIETQGNALEEAIQLYASNKADKKRYLRIMKTIAARLKQVEENGYEPPDWIFADNDDAEGEKEAKERSSSISEDGKSKRKKKKKKQIMKEQQPELTVASGMPPEPVVSTLVEKNVDPLVTALLGMGFAETQIFAAAKACGGLERATADQMVMWILSGGEESPSSPISTPDATTEMSEPAFIPTSHAGNNTKLASTKAKTPAAVQPAAKLKLAQKKNMEAVRREEAARAHAERLAAKREEQRRRNREWNNRAQARQKEEIELRAQEEAKRIAKERAAAQRQAAAGSMLAAKASKHAQAAARTTSAPAPTHILQRPSHMPVGGIPSGMVPRPYTAGQSADPNMVRFSSHGYSEYDGNSVSSGGSGRNASAQYVSSANSVSSAGSGMPMMAHQYVSSGNSVSSGGSGMHNSGMMQYQNQQQPMYGYTSSSVPPPGFQPFGGTPSVSGGSNMSLSEEAAVGYKDSSTGEIRATARSFVPTGFKPTPVVAAASGAPATTSPVTSFLASTNIASSLQPSQSSLSDEDALASLLSAAPGNAPPDLAPPTVTPTQSFSTEDQALKSVIGFDLNGSTDPSSLLGSLSLAPANDGADDVGSSIWGGSSLEPGPASLPGFCAPLANQASSAAGDPVGNEGDAGLWNASSFHQPDTSRLSSIW